MSRPKKEHEIETPEIQTGFNLEHNIKFIIEAFQKNNIPGLIVGITYATSALGGYLNWGERAMFTGVIPTIMGRKILHDQIGDTLKQLSNDNENPQILKEPLTLNQIAMNLTENPNRLPTQAQIKEALKDFQYTAEESFFSLQENEAFTTAWDVLAASAPLLTIFVLNNDVQAFQGMVEHMGSVIKDFPHLTELVKTMYQGIEIGARAGQFAIVSSLISMIATGSLLDKRNFVSTKNDY